MILELGDCETFSVDYMEVVRFFRRILGCGLSAGAGILGGGDYGMLWVSLGGYTLDVVSPHQTDGTRWSMLG